MNKTREAFFRNKCNILGAIDRLHDAIDRDYIEKELRKDEEHGAANSDLQRLIMVFHDVKEDTEGRVALKPIRLSQIKDIDSRYFCIFEDKVIQPYRCVEIYEAFITYETWVMDAYKRKKWLSFYVALKHFINELKLYLENEVDEDGNPVDYSGCGWDTGEAWE